MDPNANTSNDTEADFENVGDDPVTVQDTGDESADNNAKDGPVVDFEGLNDADPTPVPDNGAATISPNSPTERKPLSVEEQCRFLKIALDVNKALQPRGRYRFTLNFGNYGAGYEITEIFRDGSTVAYRSVVSGSTENADELQQIGTYISETFVG